jgi:hypothetical protein
MDTTSIATAHPALGRRRGPSAGQPVPATKVSAGAGAMGIARSLAEIANQPNPLDTAALSYEGGAVASLDFTPEVRRRKAVRSIGPTTT